MIQMVYDELIYDIFIGIVNSIHYMSLEKRLRDKYGSELDTVDDVEELILDKLSEIKSLSEEDKEFLERFKSLTKLSMNLLGLNSFDNFPNIPTIQTVNFLSKI